MQPAYTLALLPMYLLFLGRLFLIKSLTDYLNFGFSMKLSLFRFTL